MIFKNIIVTKVQQLKDQLFSKTYQILIAPNIKQLEKVKTNTELEIFEFCEVLVAKNLEIIMKD